MNHFISYSLFDEFQEAAQKYSEKKLSFMSKSNPCPECKGSGSLFTRFPWWKVKKISEEKPLYEDKTLICSFCSGTGLVTDEKLKNREHGEKLRQHRKKHSISIFQAAALTGYTVTDISFFERGLKDAPKGLYEKFDELIKK